jgi:WD40 repeat protein
VQSILVPDCNTRIQYVVTADSNQIVTLTSDCRIGLFNIADWQIVKSFGSAPVGPFALALSPDGKLLAVGYKQTLEIWDVNLGVLVKSIRDIDTQFKDYVGNFALAFSPDGTLLAARYSSSFWFPVESTVMLFGVTP